MFHESEPRDGGAEPLPRKPETPAALTAANKEGVGLIKRWCPCAEQPCQHARGAASAARHDVAEHSRNPVQANFEAALVGADEEPVDAVGIGLREAGVSEMA